MTISLEGRTAIVTSGAGGIGRAVARYFVDAGARVMIADRDGDSDPVDLGSAESDRWECIAHGAESRLEIANLIAATVDRFDRIDILVNAMPLTPPLAPVLDIVPADFERALAAYVSGTFALTQAVARRMATQDSDDDEPAGAIINVSSIAAQRTVPVRLCLSVCAAAIDQMTRSLAAGLAGERIRVNAVALGGILTADLQGALEEDEGLRSRMAGAAPVGRLGQADEAAGVVAFLASRHSGYVTGQVVTVDGGRTLLDTLASPAR